MGARAQVQKPIVPLLLHPDAEMPFQLEPRQYIDFTAAFDIALAQLRTIYSGWSHPLVYCRHCKIGWRMQSVT